MKEIWVRVANQSDIPTAAKWFLLNTGKSLLDMDVFKYPQSCVYVAHSDHPILYMPVQTVVMLESVGPNPAASDLELARGLAEIVKTIKFLSQTRGIGEIYFLSTDERVQRIAERHGFELLPSETFRTLRLKINSIEKTDESSVLPN